MKFYLFVFAVLIFAALGSTGLDEEEAFELKTEDYTAVDVYAYTGEEKKAFAGFYPQELRGLGSDVYISFMKNTDELLGDFITQCLREGVCPYLIIEGNKDIFNTNHIKRLAENLGYYDIKAYVELYPVYAEPAYNKALYKQFYKEAAGIFKKYAPKTEIVWAISSDYVYDEGEWLPYGADFDYMGVSVILGLNGENNSVSMWDKFEYLSRTYDYPLIITRLGIVDFSEKKHRYYKNEKEYYITEGAENLPSAYPNIAGILVFEVNDYIYEGYVNRLRFSNSDEAVKLLAEYINEFRGEKRGLKKLPYTLLAKGDSVYMPYDKFYGIFGEEYKTAVIGGEKYVNLSRYIEEVYSEKITVSEKNRYVILSENIV